ncbi:MAG: hypothetical protein V3V16_04455 [Melioribacteraceae bacterium]
MKIFQIICFQFLVLLFLISCTENNNPVKTNEETEFNNNLEIITNELEYHLDDNFGKNYSCSISGTLLNSTQDTFYSNLGDAFNSNFDQENLTIAYQTDGYFEYKLIDKTWKNIEQFRLIEGSKIIRLLPGVEYKISASAIVDTNKLGEHRIRINYYKNYLSANIDTLRDTSNVFSIMR